MSTKAVFYMNKPRPSIIYTKYKIFMLLSNEELQNSKKVATRKFWARPLLENFNLYVNSFYIVNFQSLQLRIYKNRVSTTYWPKLENFVIVDSEILSMKNEISRFDLVSRFASDYPEWKPLQNSEQIISRFNRVTS